MWNEDIRNLFAEIEVEFRNLVNFLDKVIRSKKLKSEMPLYRNDILKLENLFRGLRDYCKKPKKEKFLHPAKIIDYTASISKTPIDRKQKNDIARAKVNLLNAIHRAPLSYYKTEGKNSHIEFYIESKQEDAKYRLKALYNKNNYLFL